jgi:transcriptional regulator with XRE-family HTH domain
MDKTRNIRQIIGKRLKYLRNKRRLSLSSLAKRAGISKATLSVLEDGEGNPTISTLWMLADALEVPFGKLVVNFGEGKPTTISECGVSVRLIEHSDGPPPVDAYHMTLEPHGCREAEPHPSGVIEQITVLKGYILTGPADAPKKVNAGETHTFNADCPHIYVALTKPASAVLVVTYPPDKNR